MRATTARLHRALRTGDTFLLAAGLVGVLVWWPDHIGTALIVMGVWVLGALTYINYFVVRLAYPPRRWFIAVFKGRLPQLPAVMPHAFETTTTIEPLSIGVSSEPLTCQRDNREYFGEGVPDRGDEYFSRFQARHQALLDEQSAGDCFFFVELAETNRLVGRGNLVDVRDVPPPSGTA
jgi:hypothetical protein